MGRGGVRAGEGGGQAGAAQRRVLGVPLVPRYGARVLRERRHRRDHERELREHQGRPGGAAGRGLDLHGRGAGDDGPGRVADDGVHDAGRQAILRRHVLPARGPGRAAGVSQGARGHRVGVQEQPVADSADYGAAAGPHAPGVGGNARRGAAHDGRDEPGVRASGGTVRRQARRLRAAAQVSAAHDVRVPAAAAPPDGRSRAAGNGRDDAGPDGDGGDIRPASRRVPPVLRRHVLAGAALREDAVRQRPAGAAVPPRLAGDGQGAVPAGRRGDARLRAGRDDRRYRRILLGAGRGQRGRGGQVFRMAARGGGRCAGEGRRRGIQPVLRRDGQRQLRGDEHPQRQVASGGVRRQGGHERGRAHCPARPVACQAAGGAGGAGATRAGTTRCSPRGTG